jgi:hypothetical protein
MLCRLLVQLWLLLLSVHAAGTTAAAAAGLVLDWT